LSIPGTLPAVLLVKNVQAEPGGQVWLEFVAGGYRVTHIRTVVSTRLGEVGWVAPRGFVTSLVLAPFLGVAGWLATLAGWDAVKVVCLLLGAWALVVGLSVWLREGFSGLLGGRLIPYAIA
jgi:hypothetical protein